MIPYTVHEHKDWTGNYQSSQLKIQFVKRKLYSYLRPENNIKMHNVRLGNLATKKLPLLRELSICCACWNICKDTLREEYSVLTALLLVNMAVCENLKSYVRIWYSKND